ncbi:MAG: hypothetical protein K8W52_10150 [Deltaproteobacteria bacterium]|nr:hypothetical protein [Deltaproteobacteria bacterium]
MRSLATLVLILSTATATVGCKKKADGGGAASGTAAASGSDTGAGAGTASGSAGSGSASGAGSGTASGTEPSVNTPPVVVDAPAPVDATNMMHKAGNCPSTVVSAQTAIVEPAKGKDDKAVTVSVTSKNKEAVWAIQTRAKHLAEVQNAPDGTIDHSGKGTGGGGTGLCPIVTKSTTITVTEIADGVTIAIAPSGDLTRDALSAEVASRIAKATGFTEQTAKPTDTYGGTGGIGGGAGKHGGNRLGKGDGSGPRGSGAGTGAAKPEH